MAKTNMNKTNFKTYVFMNNLLNKKTLRYVHINPPNPC
jgi:hypothetical protein